MQKTTAESAATLSRWRTLILIHFCVVAFGVTMQMIPPILSRLVSDTGLTYGRSGTLMGLFALPGIFLALPGGWFSDAIGPRRVGIVSLLLMGIGTLLMSPLLPAFLYFGRACSGIGAGIFIVVAPQIITRAFPRHQLGLAMGIFNTAVPVGSILAFNGLGFLSGRFGLVMPIMATGWFSLAAFGAFSLFYFDPEYREKPSRDAAWTIGNLGIGIWLVAVVWTLFNIGLLAYFTFSIDHLTACGITFPTARFLGSLPMILSILFAPVAGLIIHRFGQEWSLAFIGCAVSALAVWLLYFSAGGHPVLWSVFLGVGISLVAPSVFTIAGQVVSPERLGTGYGIMNTIFNVGVFVGIPFVGKVRDMTGDYRTSFVLMAAFLLAGSVLSLVSARMLSKQ